MRICLFFLFFIALTNNLYSANSIHDCRKQKIQYGIYLYVNGGQYCIIEISPAEINPESGFVINYISGNSKYLGKLKMSKDDKVAQFQIGTAAYIITFGIKGSSNQLHLEMKNATDFDNDQFVLKQMNHFSEYRVGFFKHENRILHIDKNGYSRHRLNNLSWFFMHLSDGDSYSSNYLAIPSEVKNQFFLFDTENPSEISVLKYDEKERNYNFQFKNNSTTFNFDASLNAETKHPNDGTYFFEAMIAGQCTVKTSNDIIDLKIMFDSEIKENITEVLIKCHLDGSNVIVDECTGISKDALTIYLQDGIFELRGLQEYPINIDTLNE